MKTLKSLILSLLISTSVGCTLQDESPSNPEGQADQNSGQSDSGTPDSGPDIYEDGGLTSDGGSLIPPPVYDNCIALYHLDLPNYLTESCHGLNAEDHSTTEIQSQEGFRQARYFDGSSFLSVPYNPLFEVRDVITLEALVKPDRSTNSFTGTFGNILTKAVSIPNGLEGFVLFMGNDTVGASIGLSESEYTDITIPFQLPTDEFTHLTFTYDGSSMSLFVNELLMAEKTVMRGGSIYYSATAPLRIGSDGTSNGFIGIIDEVKISHTPLY